MLDGGLKVEAEALELVVGVPACLEGSSLCLCSTSSMILCRGRLSGVKFGVKGGLLEVERNQ